MKHKTLVYYHLARVHIPYTTEGWWMLVVPEPAGGRTTDKHAQIQLDFRMCKTRGIRKARKYTRSLAKAITEQKSNKIDQEQGDIAQKRAPFRDYNGDAAC